VVGLARQNGVLPESFDISQARRHWEVFRANVRALESLRLAPGLPVGALLFRADDQPDLARDWAFLGWDRLLAGPIEKIATPGDHYAVIRDPVVRDVAREIAARLPAAMMTE
jgi:thioesterase domain-containing protein